MIRVPASAFVYDCSCTNDEESTRPEREACLLLLDSQKESLFQVRKPMGRDGRKPALHHVFLPWLTCQLWVPSRSGVAL